MKFEGFVGGAYTAQSSVAAADECINWYPEKMEVADAKSDMILVGTPGLAVFAPLPTKPVQGQFEILDRMFAVAGGILYEVFADKSFIKRGVTPGAGPAIFESNNLELVIAIALDGWVLNLTTNVLVKITASGFRGASSLSFIDGYILATKPGSREFNISGLLDALHWDGIDVAVKEGGADNLVTAIADHREYWLMGSERGEVWWNSGNPNFPFERREGAFIEAGCAAPRSMAQFDNSFAWLGASKRGKGIVYRAAGYTPRRISTHAVELAISKYPRIDDAIGSTHEFRGHPFFRLDFPSANPPRVGVPPGTPAGATWLYDAATQLWHTRAFWNGQLARDEAHRGRYYCFAFGKHLVGDYASGNIYEMAADVYDDFGNPLRSVRTAPHQYSESKWIFYHWYQFEMQVGDGLPDGTAAQAMLQLSNDGGKTWGQELTASLGPIGAYKQLVKFRRGSRARDRVARLIVSDPVPRVLVAAHFDATVGSY